MHSIVHPYIAQAMLIFLGDMLHMPRYKRLHICDPP